MSISPEEKQDIKNKTYRPLLYIGIVSICMIFAGLTSAYLVRSADPGWMHFELPPIFIISTLIIAASSLTLWWAYQSATKDNFSGVKTGMLLTLVLGIAFIISQFMAWGTLTEQGIFLGGASSNPSGSFLYVISGLHLAHLLGGILMLIYVCIKSFKGFYHSKNLLGLQLCSIYWHFLDLLWIYLFVFLTVAH
jgi:cytochrome c oxidase subunit III